MYLYVYIGIRSTLLRHLLGISFLAMKPHQAPVSFSRRLTPPGFQSTGIVIQSLCHGSFALANSAATFRRLQAMPALWFSSTKWLRSGIQLHIASKTVA